MIDTTTGWLVIAGVAVLLFGSASLSKWAKAIGEAGIGIHRNQGHASRNQHPPAFGRNGPKFNSYGVVYHVRTPTNRGRGGRVDCLRGTASKAQEWR